MQSADSCEDRAAQPWQATCWVASMPGVRRFQDLVCWQLSTELKRAVYLLADSPAMSKDFAFRDQIRDASASAPRNIAEGFGRRTHDDFARFLDIARASLTECENHFEDAVDRGYLDRAGCDALTIQAHRAAGAVAALQRYLRGQRRRPVT